MSKTPKVSKGEEAATTAAATPTSADQADAAKEQSVTAAGPAVTDAPPHPQAAGTVSTDDASGPRAEGGTGDTAGPAGFGARLAEIVKDGEDRFRRAYPHFTASIEAFYAASPDRPAVALRIAAKRDGFRRAGMAHSKEAVDHPLDAFTTPEQLEQLFAEPNLVVQLI